MLTTPRVCAQCGQVATPGAAYCARCGNAVDPELVGELHRLYGTLRDLDARIAAGRGDETVRELRADYLRLYTERRAIAPAGVGAAPAGVGAAASAPSAPAYGGMPSLAPPQADQDAAAPVIEPLRPAAAPRAPRRAFSWQAFLAEQAIAIMAYLGGFLLLVATLTFEVGAWQVLSNALKLGVVVAVYLLFGVLGIALRRAARLRTVARAYLGVFALMTPLVALAMYRFALQATGFPPSGMLCVAAAYAAVVYLALGLRTRLATYAYLGWAALVLAALALVPWIGTGREWWACALGLVATALLLPRRLARFEVAAVLGTPALQMALAASAGAVVITEALAVSFWSAFAGAGLDRGLDRAAFAAATVALAVLALGWSLTVRAWPGRGRIGVLAAADLCVAALAAQAVLGVATWAHAGAGATANTLSGLALAELGAALAARRLWPSRGAVRGGMEGLALVLAGAGALVALGNLGASWQLVVALASGGAVTVAIALQERQRWWFLAAGGFLLLGVRASLRLLVPGGEPASVQATIFACLAVALWALALALGSSARRRALAAPVYVDALGIALFTIVPLSATTNAAFQTAILLCFTVAAFVGAWRERQPVAGAGVVSVFGVLAMLPAVAGHGSGVAASALAVSLALAALGIRWALGRRWAWGPYVVGLAAMILAAAFVGTRGMDTAAWQALGISYQVWLLLLLALLAGAGALQEDLPWAMGVAALLAVWSLTVLGGFWATLVLTLVLTGAGMALRWWRGPLWNVLLYIAAIFGSLLAMLRLRPGDIPLSGSTQTFVVVLLLGFGALAYVVAAQERNAWATIGGGMYALLAAALIPGPDMLVPTVALTLGLAGLGVLVRWRFGRAWALALYAAAVVVSLLAVARVVPPTPGQIEALLLVFAALAYAIAVFEGEPRAAGLGALYAGWAALVQPDAHALLPLALVLAVGGLVAGQVAGIRWSYPFYLAAAVAAVTTALLGQSHSYFEAGALLALALMAYIIAAVESRPDVLPVALALGALALAPASGALRLASWQTVLAYAALAWVYALGRVVWQALPGLRPRRGRWWRRQGWGGDPRALGAAIHRAAGVLVGGGAVVAALLAPDQFTPHTGAAQAVVLALLSLAGLLALVSRELSARVLLYVAGELVALAITWEARWLGADNVQAFILAPASYQLLIGALLPVDERVRAGIGERLGQFAALVGALLLTLPTLGQSLGTDPAWAYALVLAVEALLLAGLGVGMHSRLLVVVGSCFVGVAALRGAVLAIQSGLPVPAVIAVLALLLMGAATWLSLRARREAQRTR